MLQEIKNIIGVTELTKSAQQRFKAGLNNGNYNCPGRVLIVNATCPPAFPYMHPQGHCLCCSTRWRKQ